MNKRFVISLVIIGFILFFAFFAEEFVLPYLFLPRNGVESNQKQSNYEVVAEDLEIPWDLVFLPEGGMLVTQRNGEIIWIGEDKKSLFIRTYHWGEGGLQGMALHPNFKENRWLYLYSTQSIGQKVFNRVERFRFEDGQLLDRKIIIDEIPGAKYHDGGRIAFGPDGYLYITTGDATISLLAQNIHSLAGKILRIGDDGSVPDDNPFGNYVYSYGHRNAQGLTWDDQGRLWSTEHGPSGIETGQDELNLVEKGKNYGWPFIRGKQKQEGMVDPQIQSGWEATWAPASALYWDGSIFFGGLRGEALYEAKVDQSPIVLKEHLKGAFGRIRTIVLGPDGFFYLTTSNQDGRGFPRRGDDKIIKLDPHLFRSS